MKKFLISLYFRVFFALVLFVGIGLVHGRVFEMNSRSRLFSRINQAYLAVVQFYCYSKDRCCKEDYKELRNRVQAVSQNGRYFQAELDFIMMNCSSTPELAREFGFSQFPTLMLFENGMPIQGAVLSGFPHEYDINNLIENYLGQDIDAILHDKRKERKEKEAAQLAGWAAWGPYWANGCGFGYGLGYGCYRPCGWGIYGGWGCGRCW